MPKRSAGLLLFRRSPELQVLLVHPGGPFWARKDEGSWSIPKGEHDEGETPEAAARREFAEEVGPAPDGPLIPIGSVKQAGGKHVTGFACEGECDPAAIRSNAFELEWPPHSGRRQSFPEIDRAGWFGLAEGRRKILAGQRPLIDRLADALGADDRDGGSN